MLRVERRGVEELVCVSGFKIDFSGNATIRLREFFENRAI